MGFLLSFVAQEGWWWRGAPARWHGVAALALAATMLALMAAVLPKRRWTVGAWAVLAGGLGTLLIGLPGVDSLATRFGLGAVILMLTVVLAPVVRRRPVSTSVGLMVVFAALAVLLWTSHFAKLTIMTGSLAAICGLAALTVRANSATRVGISGVVCGALIPTLALTGYAYDYDTVPAVCWMLAVVAIAGVWIGETPVVKRLSHWATGCICVAAVVVPCVVALLLAIAPRKSDAAPYLDYGAYERGGPRVVTGEQGSREHGIETVARHA